MISFLRFLGAALIAMSISILVHETGHFLAFKSLGIPVLEFRVGTGPEILSIPSQETDFAFSVFPLGGRNLPAGSYLETLKKEETKIFASLRPEQQAFVDRPELWADNLPLSSQMLTNGSGLLLGLIFAAFCFEIAFRISSRHADAIVCSTFDGIQPVRTTCHFVGFKFLWSSVTGTFRFLFARPKRWRLANPQELSDPEAPPATVQMVMPLPNGILMIQGEVPTISGDAQRRLGNGELPFIDRNGGLQWASRIPQESWPHRLLFLGTISVILFLLNCLPVDPSYDGSKVLWLAIQGITGQKVSLETQMLGCFVFFVSFLSLIILIRYLRYRRIVREIKALSMSTKT